MCGSGYPGYHIQEYDAFVTVTELVYAYKHVYIHKREPEHKSAKPLIVKILNSNGKSLKVGICKTKIADAQVGKDAIYSYSPA